MNKPLTPTCSKFFSRPGCAQRTHRAAATCRARCGHAPEALGYVFRIRLPGFSPVFLSGREAAHFR